MLIIEHRINTLDKLSAVSNEHGAEIDVRYHENELVLHHDPFNHHQTKPLLLRTFLEHYSLTGPLILNVKTEGIEEQCIELMQTYQVKNWFFLDLSMPYFVKYARLVGQVPGFGSSNLATRFSEFEPIEYALSFKKMAGWLWIDYFTHYPLTSSHLKQLGDHFKLCLVSPELQGHPISEIEVLKKEIQGHPISAVCTKYPERWL